MKKKTVKKAAAGREPTSARRKAKGRAQAIQAPKKASRTKPKSAPIAKAAADPEVAAGRRMLAPTEGVTVRMYRTGLGDCFLLALPKAHGSRRDAFYMLIDCGVYKGTPEPENTTQILKIVNHIKGATGGHIDLLVITHEHWDHVSAFHESQAQAVFEEIALGTLWMAWTEDGRNELANELRAGRRAARQALDRALHALQQQGLAPAKSETAALITKVLDFFGGPAGDGEAGTAASPDGRGAAPAAFGAAASAAKSALTEEAMTWIRDTYKKEKTEFRHPGEGPLKLPGVADARIYILGPPEDARLIKRYNPTGDEVYPKAMAAAVESAFFAAFGVVPARPDALPDEDQVNEARRMSVPFDEQYAIPLAKISEAQAKRAEDAPAGGPASDAKAKQTPGQQAAGGPSYGPEADPFFRDHYLNAEPWRSIDADWLEAASEFALQLDSATNNTSLAFALEIGPPGAGKILLFPGDAQVGNWESWFGKVQVGKQELGKDMAWQVGGQAVDAKDLLRRTVFYKVGHHGSHNATLRAQGLELMGRFDETGEFVAMLPVNEHVARRNAGYGEMPLQSLVKDLLIRTKGRLARNDEGVKPDDREDSSNTLLPIPGAPPRDLSFVTQGEGGLYLECTIRPSP